MRHRNQPWRSKARLWLLTSSLAAGLMGQRPVPAAGQAPVPPEPVVLRTDAAGVVLEWRAPAFSLRRVTGEDGHHYSTVEVPGWSKTDVPGQPRLPFATALAVVPPTGDVTMHIQVLNHTHRPLPHPVAPARTPVPVGDPPTSLEWEWARDERAYGGRGLRPADAVTLEEAGWQRGRRLVRLTFYPMRFDPVGGALEVTNWTHIELRFEGQPAGNVQDEVASEGSWGHDDPFTPVLQNAVVNPAQVTHFARPERPVPAPSAPFKPDLQASASLNGTPDEIASARLQVNPPAGTEYLIISHSKFITAVAPLATHRATADGLRVFSTTIEAIYAVYSGGVVTSTAIEEYITDTYYQDWPPTLAYVLLVGDGTKDTLNRSYSATPDSNYIPPYLIIVDPYQSEGLVASDNRYVTVDGPDNLADVFIGRLPVNTVAETTTVVEKILNYELNPPQWPWNQRVLFFAGDESGGNYHDYSDDVFATLPITYSGRRVYFCTSGCNQPHLYANITAAHDATLRELNVGGLLSSYIGHSSWQQWALDPTTYAPMFHLDDVASLHNRGALPVILEMTCYTSDFANPAGDTLDESLLRRPGGGAVATWGPTTQGSLEGHKELHPSFFDAVFQHGITELGPAIEKAKSNLPGWQGDLRDTFVLLGDPAMDLNLTIVPWAHEVFLPSTLRDG
jgi:hypothetical protein